jgi:rhamnogalacturonan endolyase
MHDSVYRMGIAWQNTAYNQPPHIGFYLGEDIREAVLGGELHTPAIDYTASIDSMRHTLDLELIGKSFAILGNKLDQAKHQLDKGKHTQAAKHMEDFIKHLNRISSKTQVDESLKTKMTSDAKELIESWK